MRSFKNWAVLTAFSLLVLGIPATASAQWGGGQYDPYGRNNDPYYGRNGGYGNVNSVVRSLKIRTREFQRSVDRDLDRSRMNGSRREDQINEMVDRFKDAVNDLDNDYYNNNRGYNRNDGEMRRVFDAASQVERSINRSTLSPQSRSLWYAIRGDLQAISGGYNTYNNGRRNNRGWGNTRNNNRNGLPSWWPF